MSSIIRTISALRDIYVGDYVRFHIYKLGYVVIITDNDVVRIREATDNKRPRHYNVNKRFVSVAPTSGETASENRTLLQPPHQPRNIVEDMMEQRSDDTK